LNTETKHILEVGAGSNSRKIAVRKLEGSSPGVIWLGGYRSDMIGTKAEALVDWAKSTGRAALRFDYSGHGESGGKFRDGTISRWLEESLAVIKNHTKGPQILVGSSMGGWIGLRIVQELNSRAGSGKICGLLLIAPAPDFTSELMEPGFSDRQVEALNNCGFIEEPSDYSDEPAIITRELIDDGRNNRVLTGLINTNCPVRILQGMNDPDVPYDHAMRLVSHLPSDNVTLTLVKDGDHRLSREQDIALLQRTLDELASCQALPINTPAANTKAPPSTI